MARKGPYVSIGKDLVSLALWEEGHGLQPPFSETNVQKNQNGAG